MALSQAEKHQLMQTPKIFENIVSILLRVFSLLQFVVKQPISIEKETIRGRMQQTGL